MNPAVKRLLRACNDAKHGHRGMIVGLPKVTVDESSLRHVLKRLDALETKLNRIEAQLLRADVLHKEALDYIRVILKGE